MARAFRLLSAITKLERQNDFTYQDRAITTPNKRPKMLSRTLRVLPRRMPVLRSAYSTANDNPVPANDPKAREPRSPVSATNATPTSSEGSMDRVLQESVEAGEQMRTMQAPNRKGIWSRSQAPREKAMVGPRFEQTIMEDQVRTAGCGKKRRARDIGLFLWAKENSRRGHMANNGRAAETSGCHRPHSQAARALDAEEGRFLRRRRRPSWSPPYFHQHRQASDLRVHLLRRAIRE